jgi:adenosylcobinamide-GDP ribazoletransferase
VCFLTRLPAAGRIVLGPDDVGRAGVFFPLAGAAIGALVGVVASSLDGRLSAVLAAAIAVALEVLLTGAIHLDALADTADGLGAGTRERALEVMRDPAVGAFGAVAVGLSLLVKTAGVAAVAAGPEPVVALAAVFAVSRAAPVALAWALPYAHPVAGSGAALTTAAPGWPAAALVLAAGGAIAALGLRGVWLVLAGAVAAVVAGVVARRRLGGVTGDVLGASVELTALLALVAAAASR